MIMVKESSLKNSESLLETLFVENWRRPVSGWLFITGGQDVLQVLSGAVYDKITQLDHGCNSNAHWSCVNGNVQKKKVRCVKDIKKGEEILKYYQDNATFTFGFREDRRQISMERFGFICRV